MRWVFQILKLTINLMELYEPNHFENQSKMVTACRPKSVDLTSFQVSLAGLIKPTQG